MQCSPVFERKHLFLKSTKPADRRMFPVRFCLLILLQVLIAQFASAAQPYSGNWSGEWDSIDGPPGGLSLSVTQTGLTLSGEMSVLSTECGDFLDLPMTGTVSPDGLSVSFDTQAFCAADQSDNELQFTEGRLTSDNRIDGNYVLISDFVEWDSGTFFLTRSVNLITATAGTGGSIAPSDVVSVTAGSSQQFTISPSAGFGVLDVLVDGQSVGAVTTYNFPAVSANHLITATFKPLEPDPGPGLTEQQLLIILKMLLGNSTVEEEE